MIYYNILNITDNPITSEQYKSISVDSHGNPIIENGKQKSEIKQNNPKRKIKAIAHYAMENAVERLNKKYVLNIKPNDLFGGSTELYIKKFISKLCERIDFLDDNQKGIINEVFSTPVKYENTTKYLNINDEKIAKHWGLNFASIIEEQNKDLNFPLTSDCIYEIHKYINSQLNLIFEDLENARIMIKRNESFSKDLGITM